MAEEEKRENVSRPKRNFPSNRPPGPPRNRPGINRALNNFGVRDLRELLDKKRQEQDQTQELKVAKPPPDPSYNFLKDPFRDNSDHDGQYNPNNKAKQFHTFEEEYLNKNSWRGHSPRGSRGRGRGSRGRGAPSNRQEFMENYIENPANTNSRRTQTYKRETTEAAIENPVNIKIELSTATGQRNCILDQATKIAEIKHVPDRRTPEHRPFKGRALRGGMRLRGRGRGARFSRHSQRGEGKNSATEDQNKDGCSLQSDSSVDRIEATNDEPVENVENEEYYESEDNNYNPTEVAESNVEESAKENSFEGKNLQESVVITASKFKGENITKPVEILPKGEKNENCKNASDEKTEEKNSNVLQESVVITASKFKDENVTRTVEILPKSKKNEDCTDASDEKSEAKNSNVKIKNGKKNKKHTPKEAST